MIQHNRLRHCTGHFEKLGRWRIELCKKCVRYKAHAEIMEGAVEPECYPYMTPSAWLTRSGKQKCLCFQADESFTDW